MADEREGVSGDEPAELAVCQSDLSTEINGLTKVLETV